MTEANVYYDGKIADKMNIVIMTLRINSCDKVFVSLHLWDKNKLQ